LKKPAGSVWFQFYKEKTEPNRTEPKQEKNRAKPEKPSQTEKTEPKPENRAKTEKTEPNRSELVFSLKNRTEPNRNRSV
jgi:hypothetical protein